MEMQTMNWVIDYISFFIILTGASCVLYHESESE